MAEEDEVDEVDILGDFNLENMRDSTIFDSSVIPHDNLLDCDYTIHPQWLLDKPSGNPALWYGATGSDELSEITDESGWTEKEKDLLRRGIEIFGKSPVNLSQFVGSRNPSEVRYYLKNFYNDQVGACEEVVFDGNYLDETAVGENEIINEVANVEEVVTITTKSAVKVRLKPKFKFKTKLKQEKSLLKSNKKLPPRLTKVSNLHLMTGAGLGVPVCKGEQVIKINKDSSEDEEINIEDDEEMKIVSSNPTTPVKVKEEVQRPEILLSNNIPTDELILNPTEISDGEKYVFNEFFEGRTTKTPSRYLRIRNHIITCWRSSKPNYVTKTSIRNGLRQCGDVNCIGRIHSYLEQLGAINFGNEQVVYLRPLIDYFDKILDESSAPSPRKQRKKFINDGEGGCTLRHDSEGTVIDTTVVNKEERVARVRAPPRKSIQLIYCRVFEKQQDFKVKLDLSVLILLDLHAHTQFSEVMGLIGGFWDPKSKVLWIKRYEPCKNLASSTTHCDMCPVSQAKATDNLHRLKYEVLGWFHSHPTFAPEPSQQDVDTQLSVQCWIGVDKPCIGVILSPFSLQGALIASPYRCLIVENGVPFKLKVLLSTNFDLKTFLFDAKALLTSTVSSKRIKFDQIYSLNNSITYRDKFIQSVKMHLAKCSDLNKQHCEVIVDSLNHIVR